MFNSIRKNRLFVDISANSAQIFITQLTGLILFYLSSRYLSKTEFGDFNWSMAVSSTLLTVASLGLDVIFVRKIALKDTPEHFIKLHFFHTLASGICILVMVLLINIWKQSFTQEHPAFNLVSISLVLLTISSTFRLSMMGFEAYKALAWIALVTNGIKLGFVLICSFWGGFTLNQLILGYLFANVSEWVLGYVFISKQVQSIIIPVWHPPTYLKFIRESLPQLGVVLFDSALARMDWILLGLLSSSWITAEYSFAYRMYESSKLPLIIIGPILLTRFTKLFNSNEGISIESAKSVQHFFKWELFIVSLIPIILVSCWSPLMDFFTDNKYGKTDELCYRMLAACVPLHAIINYLWSMGFAQGQIRAIFMITLSVATLNIALNLILIPMYGSNGAALSFLIATLIQALLYAVFMKQEIIKLNYKNCFWMFLNSLLAIVLCQLLFDNIWLQVFSAVIAYGLLAVVTKQIEFKPIGDI